MLEAPTIFARMMGHEQCYQKARFQTNMPMALTWYGYAAQLGSISAYLHLAEHYKNTDLQQHYACCLGAALLGSKPALRYLEGLAAENNADAQHTLGQYYCQSGDIGSAITWWMIAVERGHQGAIESLKTTSLDKQTCEKLANVYETGDAAHKKNLSLSLVFRTKFLDKSDAVKLMHMAGALESDHEDRQESTLLAWEYYSKVAQMGCGEAAKILKIGLNIKHGRLEWQQANVFKYITTSMSQQARLPILNTK